MSENHRNVTCPDCGSKFNLADRLRSHIEAEVRSDLHASIRKEMEEELKERPRTRRRSRAGTASLEKKITNQAEEISGLREAKVELFGVEGAGPGRDQGGQEGGHRGREEEVLRRGSRKRRRSRAGQTSASLEKKITNQAEEISGLREAKVEPLGVEGVGPGRDQGGQEGGHRGREEEA